MDKSEKDRALAKSALILCKAMAGDDDDRHLVAGYTAADLLRIWRNRIWDKYGAEELEALETETDLGL